MNRTLTFFMRLKMDKFKKSISHNYVDREFPDVKLGGCFSAEFNPSQLEKVSSDNGYIFVLVSDGKGIAITGDKRQTLTAGNGVVVMKGTSVTFKADSIEPFTLVAVNIIGEAANELAKNAIKRDGDIFLKLEEDKKICECAIDLVTECSKACNSDYSIVLSLYGFLNSFYEHYMDKKIPTKNVYMTRAVEYIKQNFNKNISVENIANLLGIERSYLSRLFKTYKNKSTQNYIIDYRMEQAKRMFEEEDVNVSQVCVAVGYTNIYCFSRIFKSRIGMPPKEYMERCRKKNI